jgi:uncharacterized protein
VGARALSRAGPLIHIAELEAATKISRPSVIVGVPEVGLVGTIAASYLVEQLKLPEIANLESDLLPPVVIVHDSEPKPPIRMFGKDTLAVIVSEIPLVSLMSYEFASQIVAWCKAKQGKMVLGATGLPSDARAEASSDSKPVVLAVTNDGNLRKSIKSIGAEPFEQGMVAGAYATLIMRCVSQGVPNLTLLAESYAMFPDPGAAAAVVQVLSKLLQITVDVKPLLEGAEEIRLRMRGLMSQTQEAIQQQAAQTPAVYR